MKAMILFIGWCILFVLCWPLALLALILLPVVWLLSLPLRFLGIAVGAVFARYCFYRLGCCGGGNVIAMLDESAT
jgi:hypothetical protein